MVKQYSDNSDFNKIQADTSTSLEAQTLAYIYSKVLGRYVLKSEEAKLIQKQKENDQFWSDLFSQAMEDAIIDLQNRIAYHQEQLTLFMNAIAQHREQLQELANAKDALIAQKLHFEEYGYFQLDENGQFLNPKVEALLQAYETRNGITIDRSNASTYPIILQLLQDVEVEQDLIHEQLEEDETAYEDHKTKRDEAVKLLNQLENGDLSEQLDALQQLDQLPKAQERHLRAEQKQTNQQAPSSTQFEASDYEMEDFNFGFSPLHEDFNAKVMADEKEKEPIEIQELDEAFPSATISKSPSI